MAATLPGVYAALIHYEASPHIQAMLAGTAILAAAFLLLWACEAAQADISQALALAVVALVAVLPEYAVDMYFTWKAGQFPDSDYPHYAIANMTGANRLLIGVAWTAVVFIFWMRTRKGVRLDPERRIEVFFLGLATIWGLLIPIKGSLAWYDGVFFIGLYIWYIAVAAKRPCTECEATGPAEMLVELPKTPRRTATALLFLFAAGVIVANAERFCEGLVGAGKQFGIDEFFLVQWLAPVASEAPEFVLALMFAWHGRASLALGSLLSAELNQWTLLVGMIPGVYALSFGALWPPIPMDGFQMQEILLTACQSLLAVVMLANLRLSAGEAVVLVALFVGQLLAPAIVPVLPGGRFLGITGDEMHPVFSLMYASSAIAVFASYPSRIGSLIQGVRREMQSCPLPETECEASGDS